MAIRRIALLTGGGDCPGLNAAIRAVAKTAMTDCGWDVIGILDGFDGLITGRKKNLSQFDVSNILPMGGTILGTSNKADPFAHPVGGKKIDVSDDVVSNLKNWGVDALFCIGGDGTCKIAGQLMSKWPNIICVPKTIDNDLLCTDQTFGFDTACNFVMGAIDRIHSTAQSHHRVMVIEVMGRYAGWIALEGGLAGGGDVILIPEIPFKWDAVCGAIEERSKKGKRFSIVVVSEGAHPEGEGYTVNKVIADSPDPVRLGGIGARVADMIEKMTYHESRVTVLGHLQRGGSPTFFDRMLATAYGIAAVKLAAGGKFGKMVAFRDRDMKSADIKEVSSGLRLVSCDHKLIRAGESIGTSFGM